MARAFQERNDEYAKFEADMALQIEHEMGLQRQRTERHRLAREESQKNMRLISDRLLQKEDKLKIVAEVPDGITPYTFDLVPVDYRKKYRLQDSHNYLIEWVRLAVEECESDSLVISLPLPESVTSQLIDELTPSTVVDLVVRAAYWAVLTSSSVKSLYFHVVDKDTRSPLLTALRDLRQVVESEGFDWFSA
eukprot:TRINITY_DN14401_c0_g1_i1.p1 TRINITY_DN14401_c0_g1~~TRINITY_DN14401_c0_g1_i1.p1  ORF type:complete len:192 (+),score=28.97 TRINITY_DN14401_c0_g1_i1:158-733(+)